MLRKNWTVFRKKYTTLNDKYHDWLGDGTFDISPTFFKQGIMHIIHTNTSFIMIFYFIKSLLNTHFIRGQSVSNGLWLTPK
jgi:hypothetical protein